MITYLIKNNLTSLLTAVFYSYKTKTLPDHITCDNVQIDFTCTVFEIGEEPIKAARVDKKLKSILTLSSYQKFYIAAKSGKSNKWQILFKYAVAIIDADKDISDMFTDKRIFEFNKTLSEVTLEAHRLKGFIRFNKLYNGVFYSAFSPDNDVSELIFSHFKNRYANIPFILHDVKNNVICAYFNGKEKIVKKQISKAYVTDEVASLFKSYYNAVNIPQRKNPRQMLNYMPKRYHAFMPEKDELLQ